MNRSTKTLLAALVSTQMLSACAWFQQQDGGDQPQPQASAALDIKEPSPDNADELYAYALRLEEQGQDSDAMGYYLQATQVNPEYLKAHIALAQLYTKYKRTDEAKIAYENVLRLDRNHPFVKSYKEARLKYYSALNIAQNEEYEKALKLLGEAPPNTPLDMEIQAMQQKWQDLLKEGSSDKKVQEISEQASLLAYQGKYAEAIELIKTAPGASDNTEIQDKINQWKKVMTNRGQEPEVSETPAPNTNLSAKTRYLNSNDVKLRQSPYLYAETLGELKRDQAVEVLLENGYEADGYQWSKIKTADGKTGWVAANQLRKSLTDPAPKSTPLPNQPDTNTESNSAGFGTRYIKGNNVNIRRSPSTSGTRVTVAMNDAPVIVMSEKNISADGYSWVKVKLSDGQVGWVADNFLRAPTQVKPPSLNNNDNNNTASENTAATPAKTMATINATNVNVRLKPSLQGKLLTRVSRPAQVELLPDGPVKAGGYTWQRIKLSNGTTGWMVTRYLSKSASQTTAARKRKITGDHINVRTSPGLSGSVVTRVSDGATVTLMSDSKVDKDGYSWVKIRLENGKLGWIADKFVSE